MTIYGPDLSNNNWNSHSEVTAWLDACFHREGFSFMEHKVSEGNYYKDPFWPSVRDWCKANDVPCIGYHYVTTNDAHQQVAEYVGNGGGTTVMLDVEANSGGISNIWAVVAAFKAAGVEIVLSYIPHWYWQQIGSPSLVGLPGLLSSSYFERGHFASVEYVAAGGDSGPGWNGYGGTAPVIWQFTDGAIIDGKSVDCNAFKGSLDDLRTLFRLTPQGPFMALSDAEQTELLTKVRYLFDQSGPGFDVWGPDGDLGKNAAGQRRTLRSGLAALLRKDAVPNG